MLLYYKVIIGAFDVEVIYLESTDFIHSVLFKSSCLAGQVQQSLSVTGVNRMHTGFWTHLIPLHERSIYSWLNWG